jgi:hypothetical protein
MIAEIGAAVQSFRVLSDMVQTNRTLRNFNELVTAVYEVNAKLRTVQSGALVAQEQHAMLTQRIRELEQEIVELKHWDCEKEYYQLTQLAPGVFVYALKPGIAQDEPPHNLCTNCFDQGQKSILQSCEPGSEITLYGCPRCKTKLRIDHQPLRVRHF